MSVKKLRSTLSNIGYYRRFICNYPSVTAPLEKILKKFERFAWFDESEASFNAMKEKLEAHQSYSILIGIRNFMSILTHQESPWELFWLNPEMETLIT